jgi:dTMP kinase
MKFITFEGCEFCGKSTQVKLLEEFFKSSQRNVFTTREPGGTSFAEKIRTLLLSSEEVTDSLVEYLLFAAARKDHVDTVIKPKLQQGFHVISDRFYDSSLCYQGYYKKLSFDTLEEIRHMTIGDFKPDLTFLIDISIDQIERRSAIKRAENNIYDKKGTKFHQTIRDGYLEIAKNNPQRIIVINGNKEVHEVHSEIIQIIQERIL